MNKHIYIVTRFSLISKNLKGTWLSGKGGFDEYVSKIMDNERLKQHFELFEKIALESLLNQKKYDITKRLTLILLTSEFLPEIYKKKLTEYQIKYPWIKVSYLDENCGLKEYNKLLEDEVKNLTNLTKTGTLFATVRLDDDDALSINFLQKLSNFLNPQFIGFAYSAPRGCVGFLNNQNKYTDFHKYDSFNIALGLSFINYYAYSTQSFHNKYISIYDLGDHSFIDRVVPVITDGSYLAYLRTRHQLSDSDSDYLTNLEKKKPKINAKSIKENIEINENCFL